MGVIGAINVFCAAFSSLVQAIAAILFIWDWRAKGGSTEAHMAFGRKLFAVILVFAALSMGGFAFWLYEHPPKPTVIEKLVPVEKIIPCPPTKTGPATGKGANSIVH